MTSANRPILPPARLGVIGGGQLGRMFVQAAQRMGYRTVVLAAAGDAPAAQVAHETIVGPPGDFEALKRFRDAVDAVTVEFENVSAPALRWLARTTPVRPGWKTVRTCQNRLREKSFLRDHRIGVGEWRPVRSDAELAEAGQALGFPLILKTADSGYDGKGQVRVESAPDLQSAWIALRRMPCVAEAVVAFERELSVVVARGLDGSLAVYDPIWNRHERHILDLSVVPPPIEARDVGFARWIAGRVAERLEAIGVLCVEFFQAGDKLLVNEIAPRPHNSGHLTIEAAPTSQFAQQVRALCGLPLGPVRPLHPSAMANLLGDLWAGGEPRWDEALRLVPEAAIHLYGKRGPAPGRKMGHLTVVAEDAATAERRAIAARDALTPPP